MSISGDPGSGIPGQLPDLVPRKFLNALFLIGRFPCFKYIPLYELKRLMFHNYEYQVSYRVSSLRQQKFQA